jgi:hypothetical protein
MRTRPLLLAATLLVCPVGAAVAVDAPAPRLVAKTFEGLKLRNLGPAFMSGRIADVAIEPGDPSTWYVAVGSGGVWKTTNAGTTWTPLFDKETSYSIGCVTLDPTNPHVVWGLPRDPARAREFLSKACDLGDQVGCTDLEMLNKRTASAKKPRRH